MLPPSADDVAQAFPQTFGTALSSARRPPADDRGRSEPHAASVSGRERRPSEAPAREDASARTGAEHDRATAPEERGIPAKRPPGARATHGHETPARRGRTKDAADGETSASSDRNAAGASTGAPVVSGESPAASTAAARTPVDAGSNAGESSASEPTGEVTASFDVVGSNAVATAAGNVTDGAQKAGVDAPFGAGQASTVAGAAAGIPATGVAAAADDAALPADAVRTETVASPALVPNALEGSAGTTPAATPASQAEEVTTASNTGPDGAPTVATAAVDARRATTDTPSDAAQTVAGAVAPDAVTTSSESPRGSHADSGRGNDVTKAVAALAGPRTDRRNGGGDASSSGEHRADTDARVTERDGERPTHDEATIPTDDVTRRANTTGGAGTQTGRPVAESATVAVDRAVGLRSEARGEREPADGNGADVAFGAEDLPSGPTRDGSVVAAQTTASSTLLRTDPFELLTRDGRDVRAATSISPTAASVDAIARDAGASAPGGAPAASTPTSAPSPGSLTTSLATSQATADGSAGVSRADVLTRTAAAQGWAERIADALRLTTLRDGAEMRLRLDPPGLGNIDLRIALQHDGVRATIVAEHDATRALLTSQQHVLQAALERSDIRLAGFSVGLGLGGSGGETRTDEEPRHHGPAATATALAPTDGAAPGTALAAPAGRVNVVV